MAALRHRLFYALRPPVRQRALIGAQRDRFDGDSRVANDRLHLTLGVTEDFDTLPEMVVRRMRAIGDATALDPLPVRLDRIVGSNRSIALRPGRIIAPLALLARQLGSDLRRAGLLRSGWEFSPHLTLVYRNGMPFQQPVDPIGWQASDFVLIHSLIGATRHIDLARWPLASRQLSLAL